MVIGLTGKTCSGKNYICSILNKKGYVIVDADLIAHVGLSAKKDLLVKDFGKEIINEKGEVDRTVLGRKVFSDKEKLRKLETILGSYIIEEIQKIIKNNSKEIVIINAPLLQRYKLDKICDKSIFVTSCFFVRYLRARKRDKISFYNFYNRNKNQKDISLRKLKKEMEVKIIHNSFNSNNIYRQINSFCDRIKSEE